MTSEKDRIARAAGVVSAMTLVSRLLGLVREMVFAALIGAGFHSDAFRIAFRIPNLLRDLFAEGALSAAFVPTYAHVLAHEGRDAARALTNRLLTALAALLGTLVVLGIVFAGPIVGKLAPYNVLGLIAIAVIYVAARLFFGVPFRGSHLVFIAGCFLFLTTYLAQGLLISVTTRSQLVAMQVAMVSGLLPSTLLSGFMFPVESMPTIFQWLTAILPARWFMVICRSVFLKGSGLSELWLPFTALTGMMVLMVFASVKRFKRDVEP